MSAILYPNSEATVLLDGYLCQHLAAGDNISITPSNAQTARTNSQKSGVSASTRVDAGVTVVAYTVQRNSPDDKKFNDLLNGDLKFLNGSVQRQYKRDGGSFTEFFELQNGTVTTKPTFTYNNQDGSETAIYTVEFREGVRSI